MTETPLPRSEIGIATERPEEVVLSAIKACCEDKHVKATTNGYDGNASSVAGACKLTNSSKYVMWNEMLYDGN